MRTPRLPGVGAVTGVVRVTRQTLTEAVGTSTRVTVSVGRAIAAGDSPGEILEELAADTSDRVRRAFTPEGNGVVVDNHGPAGQWRREPATLPELFAALLDLSADIHAPHNNHPAYFRLMAELAPDEARILRLFARQGPQPALDARTKRPFGVGSKLVAPGSR